MIDAKVMLPPRTEQLANISSDGPYAFNPSWFVFSVSGWWRDSLVQLHLPRQRSLVSFYEPVLYDIILTTHLFYLPESWSNAMSQSSHWMSTFPLDQLTCSLKSLQLEMIRCQASVARCLYSSISVLKHISGEGQVGYHRLTLTVLKFW